MYSNHNGAIRWLIPNFLSDSNSNVCSISQNFRDFRKNTKMPKVSTLKMEVKFKEKNRTCAIRLEMIDFIQVIFHKFNYMGTYVYAKGNTHTRHIHTAIDRSDDYR